MYTDSTILEKGKYKFHKLRDIPSSYLINVYESGTHGILLREYLKENIERIRSAKWDSVESKSETTCLKTSFPTEKEAKYRMRHIQYKSKEDVMPVRCYECPDCGAWHLTSKERI